MYNIHQELLALSWWRWLIDTNMFPYFPHYEITITMLVMVYCNHLLVIKTGNINLGIISHMADNYLWHLAAGWFWLVHTSYTHFKQLSSQN